MSAIKYQTNTHICSICETSFKISYELLTHLKDLHKTPKNYHYVCKFNFCSKNFLNFSKFKTHITKHDLNESKPYSTLLVPNSAEFSQNSSFTVNPTPPQEVLNVNLHEMKQSVLKSLISFALHLHGKANLTRKGISQIENAVTEDILTPQYNLLIQFLQSTFEELLSFIKNPFSEINSEYKFFRKMESLDIFRMPKLFTINQQLDDIFFQGSPTIKENTIEGCLCDIQFQLKRFFQSPGVLKLTFENITKINESKNLFA